MPCSQHIPISEYVKRSGRARALTLSNLLQRFGYRDVDGIRAEGRAEGVHSGRRDGKQESLRRLLERRFGALDQDTAARLAGASNERLDAWTLAVLDAPDLATVLATT